MVNFVVYDVFLLGIFAILVSFFLYRNRNNLKREGLLFLYKASWGIKLINYTGNKYKKTLKFLSYISISIGYLLMIGMLYFLGKIIWIYAFRADIVRAIKVPPILPLVPYLPQAFKLDLPPFYFTYWIIILAIIAISHEFAHGIFAAYNKIKIKSTGFGFFPFFLPVFLAAFVELDEKKMAKHKKIQQMAILSSGTFANVITGVLFLIVLIIFFTMAFIPSGVIFNEYAYTIAPVSGISSINNISLNNATYIQVLEALNNNSFGKIVYNKEHYIGVRRIIGENLYAELYYDSPAIRNKISQIISSINGEEVNSIEKLGKEIEKYSPGDNITIFGINENEEQVKYNIILGEDPKEADKAWLGIAFAIRNPQGIAGKLSNVVTLFKDPNIYYKPKINGMSVFIYNLLWWLILICFSVALVNMLPVGIFDGGKFFYLTVLGITRSKKIAQKSFAFVTYLFLLILAFLMVFWAWSFIK